MRNHLAAGADDGLDELMVGVLVAALHQLLRRMAPVGGIIIRAGEIERANRIVRRTNHVERIEAQQRMVHGVAQRRRLRRRDELAETTAKVEPWQAKPMRGRRPRRRGDDNDLRDRDARELLEEAVDGPGTVAT